MKNTNISPREKECLRKREQRRQWSPEMRLKVQEYDHNRKRVHEEQNKTASECARKREKNCKVSLVGNENGFKKSVKKLITVGLNSPKKKEFLLDYFEKRGMKVASDGEEAEKCKSDKTVSILQLKAFKLQNRVEDHKKLVERVKDIYGSLNKAAKALKIHYCTLWHLCQSPDKSVSNKRTESMKEKQEVLSDFYQQKSVKQMCLQQDKPKNSS